MRQIVADFSASGRADGYRDRRSAADSRQPSSLADREALSRALWNLLDNAVKYSPEMPTVWVRRRERTAPSESQLPSSDEGSGIPSGSTDEIFDRFVRGADSKARHIRGTGIGLAMVREIVRAHGGDIR